MTGTMIDWLAGLDPRTLLLAIAGFGLLLALPFWVAALRRLRRARPVRGLLFFLAGTALVLAGALAGLLAASLHGYSRLTQEQEAAHATLRKLDAGRYELTLVRSGAIAERFELRGDEWQIDARLLKWKGLATLAGFDTVYRLERLAGRQADLARERSEPRTVYALTPEAGPDFWVLAKRYHAYLPFVDALYGGAAYVPMADGAEYRVAVSASGLVVRPANPAAQDAVGAWR